MRHLKHVRELNELAATYGFEEGKRTRGDHLMFQHRVNRRKVFMGTTVPDYRDLKNFESTLRRVAELPPLKPGESDQTR